MTPSDALQKILEDLPEPSSETVDLGNASGRVLREDIYADRPFPAFDRVMMDGIAVRSSGIARGIQSFEVLGLAAAGRPAQSLEQPKDCWRVNTGAVLPQGADQIIPIERVVEITDQRATVENGINAAPYEFVHREGSDFKNGDRLIGAGAVIGSKEVGVLASVGSAHVTVAKPPEVILISTGDELVPVDQIPKRQQIRRSNTWAMASACMRLGIPAKQIHIPDDPKAIEDTLTQLLHADSWIILSGGISKGTHDFIPQTLQKLGAHQRFQWVKQRPGKPMAFYKSPSGAPVFALPGNPMSTLCCFHRYVIPAIHMSLGQTTSRIQTLPLASAFHFDKPLALFLPIQLAGIVNASETAPQTHVSRDPHLDEASTRAIPKPTKNSGDFASIMETDGFLELPAGINDFAAGARFRFYPWI